VQTLPEKHGKPDARFLTDGIEFALSTFLFFVFDRYFIGRL